MSESSALQALVVTQKHWVARDIMCFELQHPEGQDLPPFSAGAHIPVQVPGGSMRAYSLCGNTQDLSHYQIAVKREANGRGGSKRLVDEVQVGQQLNIGLPQNMFELSPKVSQFVFIAGGIGITPIRSMMTELLSEGLRKFKLIYLTRDAESTAFLNEFQAPQYQGKVHIHHDLGDATRSMDLWPVFEKFTGAHMYCCGPQPLMDAVRDMSGHWPASAVHFESFGADRRPKADDRSFQVVLHRSGKTLEVPADQSILETLRRHHISISSSCESGTCGSCKVGLLEGVADHRDMVLREDEKSNHLMVCVSRAQSNVLVIDC